MCKLLEDNKKAKAPPPSKSVHKITSMFNVQTNSVKKFPSKHPLQVKFTNDLVDIVAEGLLPMSFVELESVKRAYSNMVPEFQVRLNLISLLMLVSFILPR